MKTPYCSDIEIRLAAIRAAATNAEFLIDHGEPLDEYLLKIEQELIKIREMRP